MPGTRARPYTHQAGEGPVDGSAAASRAGRALASGEPVIVDDLRFETRFRDPALWQEHGVVSGMSVVISRLGAASRTEAVALALRRHLVS